MPLYKNPRLKFWLKEESPSMKVEAYSKECVHYLRANVAVLIAEHSKNANLDAYIPYTAMIYFDHFISTNELPTLGRESDEYRVRVIAFGCLFYAWDKKKKVYGPSDYMENLTDLGIDKRDKDQVLTLIHKSERNYARLTDSANALSYVPYFLSLFDSYSSSLKSNVNELIVQSQRGIRFTQFKASTIAASAILCLLGPSPRNVEKFRGEYVKLDQNQLADCVRMMIAFRNKIEGPIIQGASEIEKVDRMKFELKWMNDETQDLTIDSFPFPLVERPILSFLIKLVCCKEMD